jgi:hypothetical protein
LFGERQVVKRLPEQVLPDFPALHSQLQQHRPTDSSGRIRLQSLLRA